MNLSNIFNTQIALDAHITEKHPAEEKEDRLAKKILALQVELGELANEWRGFKYWSNDQEARVYVPNPNALCKACDGQGYTDKHLDIKQWKFCKECDGCGAHFYNPLLEEYVDCLHFIVSIGIELNVNPEQLFIPIFECDEETDIFISLFFEIARLDLQRKASLYKIIFTKFMGLGAKLGFSLDQIEEAYYSKNKINYERQENGY